MARPFGVDIQRPCVAPTALFLNGARFFSRIAHSISHRTTNLL
jgi:hypothetical protein